MAKALSIVGFSGSGKTELICRLLDWLARRGLRVAVLKHTHHTCLGGRGQGHLALPPGRGPAGGPGGPGSAPGQPWISRRSTPRRGPGGLGPAGGPDPGGGLQIQSPAQDFSGKPAPPGVPPRPDPGYRHGAVRSRWRRPGPFFSRRKWTPSRPSSWIIWV